MFRSNERGIAIIMALFMTMIVSALAASMAYVARTETLSSQSYTTMAHSRYGAESGLAAATNYLLSSNYQAVMPGTASDAMTNYTTSVSPVLKGASAATLSTVSGQSNYGAASVVTAFGTAASGSLTVNNGTVTYGARATLLSMRQMADSMSGSTVTLQKWEITGWGKRSGSGSSEVEVTAIIERQTVPLYRYAAFATNAGCAALTFSGGATTKSYNSSSALVGGTPVLLSTDGDVGTNGNLAVSGNPTTVNGTLSTPRTGVGSCTTSNVTALTIAGSASVNEGLVELPQVVAFPTPPAPSPAPPTTSVDMNNSFACLGYLGCTTTASAVTLTADPTNTVPYVMGNVSVGPKDLVLNAGTYIFNSITEVGNAKITANGKVIIKIAGTGVTTPISLTGGSVLNNTYLPSNMQIVYGGTGNVEITGGTSTASLIYAPNANITLTGNSDFYGAVVGGRVSVPGSANIYYDTGLAATTMTSGQPVMSSFTWRTF
jgi:hypothetical protein